MQLNCKIIKKRDNIPISIPTARPRPPFQDYLLFLAKFLVPPPVTQFLEGPTSPFNKEGGKREGPTMQVMFVPLRHHVIIPATDI